MTFISDNEFNLKFTMQADTCSIPFLDLRLFLNPNGSLHSTLYRKAAAGNTILHYTSAHPPTQHSIQPISRAVLELR